MAKLQASRFSHQTVNITPIVPTQDGPRNAYSVSVWADEQAIFQRQYTTYDYSPDGHWNIWRLFRALQQAERMADMTTTLNITGHSRKRFNEPALLDVDIGWLHMVMRSNKLVHRHGLPKPVTEKRCKVFFYFQGGEGEEQSTVFRQFVFSCRPLEAVRFGKDLEIECREALRLRRELGIPAPADEYIDT